MILDFSKLKFDALGRPEQPTMMLQTLNDEDIGIIQGAHRLKCTIRFTEPSELEFEIAATLENGVPNPIYNEVVGHTQIYIPDMGVFVVMNPETTTNGLQDSKKITAYSREKLLETKKFFIEEGTFKFGYRSKTMGTDGTYTFDDSLIGRINEKIPEWSFVVKDLKIGGLYRTFEDYDDYLLDFMLNVAPDKYRCAFVFDSITKTIYVYDVDVEHKTVPVYLDFHNLVNEVALNERSDELFTAMRPYGADELNIQGVNPTGSPWIYDLSYFIERGDLDVKVDSDRTLASLFMQWQETVLGQRELYRSISALRAAATSQLLTAQAQLADLISERTGLLARQSVQIQALEIAATETSWQAHQKMLNQINEQIYGTAHMRQGPIDVQDGLIGDVIGVQPKIDAKELEIKAYQTRVDTYMDRAQEIVNQLKLEKCFTQNQQIVLNQFMTEMDLTEETFVATDVKAEVGDVYDLVQSSLSVTGSEVTYMEMGADYLNEKIYRITGGTFSSIVKVKSGDLTTQVLLKGDIIRGTLDVDKDNKFVMSLYVGAVSKQGATDTQPIHYESATFTFTGNINTISSDVRTPADIEDATYKEGTTISLSMVSGVLYLTSNVSEYQKYSVELELYDYAIRELSEVAQPTYEFSVKSGNFLFAKEFAPFRDQLALGECIYLRMNEHKVHTPILLEVEFDYEDWSALTLTFSNRFKLYDPCNTLKDLLEKSYSASRSITAGKYIYNKTASQMDSVSKMLSDNLNAAKNTVLAASNQSVIIDGSGINIVGAADENGISDKYQVRICDRMIAMTDDGWEHAKVAIGLVALPNATQDDAGQYQYVVNADSIGGKLVITNNLLIENPGDNGIMQFKVDESGAWLYNSQMVLKSDTGGGTGILLSPKYGIAIGDNELFTTDGKTVTLHCVDEDGDTIVDEDTGFPEHATLFYNLKENKLYMNGMGIFDEGKIGGWTLSKDCLYSSGDQYYIEINSSADREKWPYAIWAGKSKGGSDPQSDTGASFAVTKDGILTCESAHLGGDLYYNDMYNKNGEKITDDDGNIEEVYLLLTHPTEEIWTEISIIPGSIQAVLHGTYDGSSGGKATNEAFETLQRDINDFVQENFGKNGSILDSIAIVNTDVVTLQTDFVTLDTEIEVIPGRVAIALYGDATAMAELEREIGSEKYSAYANIQAQLTNKIYHDIAGTSQTATSKYILNLHDAAMGAIQLVDTNVGIFKATAEQFMTDYTEKVRVLQDDVEILEEYSSQFEQTAKGFSFIVDYKDSGGAEGHASASLTTEGAKIIADGIQLKGFVTVESLEDETQQTTINGAYIHTGTLEAVDILGAQYYDSTRKYYLSMFSGDVVNGGLELRRVLGSGSYSVFKITEGDGYMSLYGYDSNVFLTTYTMNNVANVFPSGVWDFTRATVRGVAATWG